MMLGRQSQGVCSYVRSASRLQLVLLLVAGSALAVFVFGSGVLLFRSPPASGSDRDATGGAGSGVSVNGAVVDPIAFHAAVCNPSLFALKAHYESEVASLRTLLNDSQLKLRALEEATGRSAASLPLPPPSNGAGGNVVVSPPPADPALLPVRPPPPPLPFPVNPNAVPPIIHPSDSASVMHAVDPSNPPIAVAHRNRAPVTDRDRIRNSQLVNGVSFDTATPGIPILLFCFNRPDSLRQTLDSIFQYRPALPGAAPGPTAASGYPVFVSQDSDQPGVSAMIDQFRDRVFHLRFQNYVPPPKATADPKYGVYYRIAHHYKFALTYIFDTLKYDRVIIVEDDMKLAPDFFSYFATLSPLFDTDPSLYCISAWNDNGQERFVRDPTALHRTDCFPGLGWMMSRALWNELGPKWALGFWDDWMRQTSQRGNRSCIYPEINRVYTFGRDGASAGQFFDDFLKSIKLNEVPVNWPAQSNTLAGISNAMHQFDDRMAKLLSAATGYNTWNEIHQLTPPPPPAPGTPAPASERVVAWTYPSLDALTSALAAMGLMTDHKEGVPRTSYHGVLLFYWNGHRVAFRPHDWARKFLEPIS